MLKYNLFLILTFICARATSIEIPYTVNITSEVFDKIAEENVFEKAAESLLENLLSTDINTTGSEEKTVKNQDECTGGLLDFIQCVVHAKIESFRKEFSKVAFQKKPSGAFQRQTFDSKIQGSLEKWLQEFNKHLSIPNENCTSDLINK